MSPELRCGLGRVCPLNSPAWWDGWRNCCWEASRWDGWYRLSREWRKFTWGGKEENYVCSSCANTYFLTLSTAAAYTTYTTYTKTLYITQEEKKHLKSICCLIQMCHVSYVCPHLQSQLIAGVSSIHLGAGQAEPPLEAGRAFGQSVADRAKDVLVHRDGFGTWEKRRTKREENKKKTGSRYWDDKEEERKVDCSCLLTAGGGFYWMDDSLWLLHWISKN